jgi:hypothetical protein
VTVLCKAAGRGDDESSQRNEDGFVYHGVLLLFSWRWISQLQFTQFVVSPDKSLQASDRGFYAKW